MCLSEKAADMEIVSGEQKNARLVRDIHPLASFS